MSVVLTGGSALGILLSPGAGAKWERGMSRRLWLGVMFSAWAARACVSPYLVGCDGLDEF